jgi:hypothetical protein
MRFSLKWILAVTAYGAIATAAFSRPAWYYSDGLWSFSILCNVFAATLAVFARGRKKAAAIGFVLAGVGFAVFVLACISIGGYIGRVGFYPIDNIFFEFGVDSNSPNDPVKILRLRAGAALFTLLFGLIGSLVGLLAFRAADCADD